MRPLERLGGRSDHTVEMSKYVVRESKEDTMDVDRVSVHHHNCKQDPPLLRSGSSFLDVYITVL